MERHYDERHPEHLDTDRGAWLRMSYSQTKHSGIESDCERGKELEDTYDEQSDEGEDGGRIRVGPLPQQVIIRAVTVARRVVLTLLLAG
jgi:hypothetical protein